MRNITINKLFSALFLFQLFTIGFSGMALFHLLYVIVLILFLILMIQNHEYNFTLIDKIVLTYFGFRIFSILISEYPSLSKITWTREIIFYPYYFIASWYLQNNDEKFLKKCFNWIIAGGVTTAIISLIVFLGKFAPRAETILVHYSTIATQLSFVTALICAKFIFLEKNKIFYSFLILIIGLAMLLTLTRSAWISVFLIILITSYFVNKKVVLFIVPILFVLIFFITPLKERIFSFSNLEKNSSGRSLLWQNATIAIKDKPIFGWGPETFNGINLNKEIYEDPNVETWHNEFLQNGVEGGVIGFLLYSTIYSTIILILLANIDDKIINPVSATILFILIAAFFAAFFSNLMREILNGFLFKFMLASISFLSYKKIKL